VTLHLPLFAAAAAHYRSASDTAPHLVMLDEAFAGIDQGMRGRCMKLLVDFDLDLVMTSHDEWGCYPELLGLAIYEFAREPGRRGVAAIRFTWDGHERALDDPHLELVAESMSSSP
jgi:ABC-type nitrate/sulfonate/bicarbonate transport system ATPase subunit